MSQILKREAIFMFFIKYLFIYLQCLKGQYKSYENNFLSYVASKWKGCVIDWIILSQSNAYRDRIIFFKSTPRTFSRFYFDHRGIFQQFFVLITSSFSPPPCALLLYLMEFLINILNRVIFLEISITNSNNSIVHFFVFC